ncbi:hypothetical protein GOEFS_132_00230 [Gordonia effusa NBRC 100432]|uniref:Uncharacterized protein n=1 Tax=Gordonia effusa NBRC 100432 TaxID=1077974 RepID=H0R6U1_9ACTN|nr:hypothetical protein [Gordonia effusa]GAB20792.1 hypothetical protein GOEFS_132_00230 [Gordonia effusa NBRC 100432]
MSFRYAAPEHRLYDACSRWEHNNDTKALIDDAVQCLVEGLDSPHLRILAGASPNDVRDEIAELVYEALAELGIPQPADRDPWGAQVAAGRFITRPATNTIRFEVGEISDSWLDGHEVLVYIDDVEMTSLGAGLGMDPFELLIPTNRLVASEQPTRVPIARCTCGHYICGGTDVTIVREGDVVHWDWSLKAPTSVGKTFQAAAYDAEVTRIGADHSWEDLTDTTIRRVHTAINSEVLAHYGLTVDWVSRYPLEPPELTVAFRLTEGGEETHQIFLRFPWASPDGLVQTVTDELRKHPREWDARWSAIKCGLAAPHIAGSNWNPER